MANGFETQKIFIKNEEKILKGEYNQELLNDIKEAEFVNKAKKLAYQKVFEHEKKLYIEVAAYHFKDNHHSI